FNVAGAGCLPYSGFAFGGQPDFADCRPVCGFTRSLGGADDGFLSFFCRCLGFVRLWLLDGAGAAAGVLVAALGSAGLVCNSVAGLDYLGLIARTGPLVP